jgi:AraC-like DNA-binding protein
LSDVFKRQVGETPNSFRRSSGLPVTEVMLNEA